MSPFNNTKKGAYAKKNLAMLVMLDFVFWFSKCST